MNKIIIIFCALFAAPLLSFAQQSVNTVNAYNAAYGGTKNLRSYHVSSYNPAKKYVVVKLWHSSEKITADEQKELAILKSQLAKKNIEVVEYEWNETIDLQGFFKKHHIAAEVNDDKGLSLKGEKYQMQTTSKKVLLVIEDEKPTSLCTGANCETNIKYFFGLISAS